MKKELEFANEFGKRLLEITKACRVDMHEPDEQGVDAKVFYKKYFDYPKGEKSKTRPHLDNAMGDSGSCGELCIEIINSTTGKTERFNLATLIALARIGAKHI